MEDKYTNKSGSLDVNDPMAMFTASNEALNAVGYERVKINGATSIQKIDASVQRADEELFKPYQVSKDYTLSSKLGWESADKRGDLDDLEFYDPYDLEAALACERGFRTQGSAKYTVDFQRNGGLLGSMYLREVKDIRGRNTWLVDYVTLDMDLENNFNHGKAKSELNKMFDYLGDRAVSSGVEQIMLGSLYSDASEDISNKLRKIVSKMGGERIGIDSEYGYHQSSLVWSKE